MTSLFLRGSLLTLVVGSLASPCVFAATDLHKFALIDGVSRELVLQENRELMQSLPKENGDAIHYTGQLVDFPDSWARLSHIDGQWQGVVVNGGEILLVEQLADSPREATSRSAEFAVSAVKSFEELGDCAVAHPPAGDSSARQARALTSQALMGQPVSVNFPSYCAETVNGVCLVAELTVVFDEKFKQAFPSNYTSQAAAILNAVDGFYRNDFKIVFRLLRLDFTSGNGFTSSRDPFTLLEDMGGKRAGNQISSYDPNKRSLFHLVTGRDFRYIETGEVINDNVVGVANSPDYKTSNYPTSFTPVLCNSNGAAVGTSQLLYAGSSPSAARTALVVTHELGHNFGAEHDGDTKSITAASCTSTTTIMAPYVISSSTGFSTCSESVISTNISRLTSVEACFDFPVDVSLSADNTNLAHTTPSTPFIQRYTAEFATANNRTGAVTVTGTLTGDGTFGAVTLAGNNCALSNGSRTYTCTSNSPVASLTLVVNVNAASSHVGLSHSVATASNSHLYDTTADDNTVNETVLVRGPDLPPTSLTATASGANVQLAWQDHATNETGFMVERRQGSGDWTTVADNLTTNAQSYSDTSVGAQSTYSYRVRALFSGTQSAPSNEASVSTTIVTSGNGPMRIGGKGGGGGSLSPWILMLLSAVLLRCNSLGMRQKRKPASTA